ncbi:unnamed protein product (macronuclear) [Paramecium tetraurelia]|uniref:SURP motif domain-containing protein n=2 Tax=Paramecium TaxID=5884 RepID=A0C5N0_PARTE|nr:uncharacterized protein GSPATT00035226001 [Paramecium tetraurelia]CAD8213383.1 unnamed protein product [Paramecium octaurelia]CAK66097.1 unnamed protein product [Paramecium tetraurelia]|eukprot:XP_001433494.1 hypothetical protein (macronuclear) [Paramecium tetraurelia strain d4-2]
MNKSYDDIEGTLPRIGEKCTLEQFQDLEQAQEICSKLESKIQKDILIDEMKQNPQAFFNFNFTADDYYLFLVKYSMMRAERQVIEQEFTKYLKEKKIFLE